MSAQIAPTSWRQTAHVSTGDIKGWYRPLLWLSAAMAVWAIVSAIGIVVDPRTLSGDPIWAKPFKFSVSLCVYAITLAWMLGQVQGPRLARTGRVAALTGATASLIEIAIISIQVIRGTSSHFNVSTPLNSALYIVMGVGAILLFSTTAIIGGALAFFTTMADRSIQWALRLSVVIALAGISVGFIMLVPTTHQLTELPPTTAGSHSVGGDDSSGGIFLLGWNSRHGDLRIAHFVGMHALQIIPLVAVYLAVTRGHRLSVGTRTRIVVFLSAARAAVTAGVLWQALRGQALLEPDSITWTAIAVLGLAAITAAAGIVRYAHTHPPAPTSSAPRHEATMTDNTAPATQPTDPSRHKLNQRAAAAVYFALAIAGLIGTWYFNIQWTSAEGGFSLGNYLTGWFANSASSSAGTDLLVITAAACLYFWRHRRSLGTHPWPLLLIPLSFLVAVSFTFPLFLGLRELRR